MSIAKNIVIEVQLDLEQIDVCPASAQPDKGAADNGSVAAKFSSKGQRTVVVKCYGCNEEGHIKPNCPKL